MTENPPETADASRNRVRRADRTITIIQITESVVIAALVVVIALLAWRVITDEQDLRASCAIYSDVGTSPVSDQSSELGIKLVIDFRNAFRGTGCPGVMPPPSAELVREAGKYGLVVGS